MAKVVIHVWHTLTGQIVAVGRPLAGAKCVPVAGENQAVMETEIEEEHILGLPHTHVVDMSRKAVISRSVHKI
jgi:hypothetical protein